MSSTLEQQVALLAKTHRAVRSAHLPSSIATHHKIRNTDPAILIAALVAFCADGCTLPRQYWDRVDEVSARVRGRYARVLIEQEEKNLDPDL